MNQKELKELIEFLIEKDIAEFELERGDVKVKIKRGGERYDGGMSRTALCRRSDAAPTAVAAPRSLACAAAPPPAGCSQSPKKACTS